MGEKRSDVVWITSDIIFSASDIVFPMSHAAFQVLGKGLLWRQYGKTAQTCAVFRTSAPAAS